MKTQPGSRTSKRPPGRRPRGRRLHPATRSHGVSVSPRSSLSPTSGRRSPAEGVPDDWRQALAVGQASRVAFLFPGQGTQYPNMGRGPLRRARTEFRSADRRVRRRCSAIPPRPRSARASVPRRASRPRPMRKPSLTRTDAGTAGDLRGRATRWPEAVDVLGRAAGAPCSATASASYVGGLPGRRALAQKTP